MSASAEKLPPPGTLPTDSAHVKGDTTSFKEDETPVKEEETPVKEDGTPIEGNGIPVKEDGTPVKMEACPVDTASASPDGAAFGKTSLGYLPKARRPRILLMGQRQSGKTSIVQTVFRHLDPEETLFLDPTRRMQKEYIKSFLSFIVYDSPGPLGFLELDFDITGIFDNVDTIIWVFDAQGEWVDALLRFHRTLITLKTRFPKMNIEVFIHKVDGMSEDYALEIKEDIIRRTEEELMDKDLSGMAIRYHLTSIYDRTVYESLSRVLQRVTPRLSAIEKMLDLLCEKTGMVKIFLFDIFSKLYVATDNSPVDMQVMETCTQHLEFVERMNEIFGYRRQKLKDLLEDPNYKAPETCSMVSLDNGGILYMKEINQYLAIVGVTGKEAMKKRNIVDYDITVFQEAVLKLIC